MLQNGDVRGQLLRHTENEQSKNSRARRGQRRRRRSRLVPQGTRRARAINLMRHTGRDTYHSTSRRTRRHTRRNSGNHFSTRRTTRLTTQHTSNPRRASFLNTFKRKWHRHIRGTRGHGRGKRYRRHVGRRRGLVSRQTRHKLMFITIRRQGRMMQLSHLLSTLLRLIRVLTQLNRRVRLRNRRHLLNSRLITRVVVSRRTQAMCQVQSSHASFRLLSCHSLLNFRRHYQVRILDLLHSLLGLVKFNLHSHHVTDRYRLLHLFNRQLGLDLGLYLVINLYLNNNLLICHHILNKRLCNITSFPSLVINSILTSRRFTTARYFVHIAYGSFKHRRIDRRKVLDHRHRTLSLLTIVLHARGRSV